MIRMEDAAPLKRWMFQRAMDVARRVGPHALDGKEPVGPGDRLATPWATWFVYGPLRNTLGFSRVRVAYTAGAAIGPDLFTFYRSIGINLKQLYGSRPRPAPTCACSPTTRPRPTPWACRAEGVEIKLADNGEILVKSPGLLKEYYKNPTPPPRC